MPRSVSEWIGSTPDTKVPDRVKLRIWRRQCGDSNFAICPLSKVILRSTAECDLDHERALIENGEHRESNLRFVAKAAHRKKTAAEVKRKSDIDARAESHARIGNARGPLSGADAEERASRRDARSADRRGDKLPVPGVRLPRGFVTATEGR